MKLKRYAAHSYSGPVLEINEDLVSVDLRDSLYMILDGFGGSNVGDKASELISQNIKTFYGRVVEDPDSTLPFYYSPRYLIEGNCLINAAHMAHQLLKRENSGKPMDQRGGVSGIIACQSGSLLTLFSTGNCQSFLYRKGRLEIVNEPDNLRLLSRGSHQTFFETVPMSGFGLFDELHFTVKELRLEDGDHLLLITDGAYGRVSQEEIRHILDKGSLNYLEKIEELFSLANERGNLDNQSAILLSY